MVALPGMNVGQKTKKIEVKNVKSRTYIEKDYILSQENGGNGGTGISTGSVEIHGERTRCSGETGGEAYTRLAVESWVGSSEVFEVELAGNAESRAFLVESKRKIPVGELAKRGRGRKGFRPGGHSGIKVSVIRQSYSGMTSG